MRTILLFFTGIFFSSTIVWAQTKDTLTTRKDTVLLHEFSISAEYPFNDNDIMDFYRSSQFAGLDNINARLEGVSLIKRGAYALEPQISGFSGGQLNVTIDGMKMFGACTDKMDPVTSYIEPTNLKEMTIRQGSGGCLTGCNVGGSLDMTLKEPEKNRVQALQSMLGLGYESVSGSRNILFSSDYVNKHWRFGIDGVYRKNENYQAGNHQTVAFSQFEKANIHALIGWEPDSLNAFKIDYLFDEARNVGYPALPMDVGLARASLVSLEYTRGRIHRLKVKVYANSVYHLMDDSQRDSLYLLENGNSNQPDSVFMRMDMPGLSQTAGVYMQLSLPLNRANVLLVKLDHYTNNSVAEMTMHMHFPGMPPEKPMYMQTWPEMMRQVSGLYIRDTWFPTRKISLGLSGRLEYNQDVLRSEYGRQQFSVFNYNLDKSVSRFTKNIHFSTKYYPNHLHEMELSGGWGERMPAIGERLGFYLYNAYDGYDYIGDPDLLPEKSFFAKFDFRLTRSKIKLHFSQSVNALHDYIIGISDTLVPAMNFYAKGIRRYINIPKAHLSSTDFNVYYQPFPLLTIFMLTKYTFGAIDTHNPLPLMPPLKNVLAARYYTDRFSVRIELESALEQHRVNIDYGEYHTPAYSIVNFNSGYNMELGKYQCMVNFGIMNIFNRCYYEHLDWGRIYRPGRSFNIFIKVDL